MSRCPLSGTASLIRWEALESVRTLRGYFYNVRSITEDFALTLDLKVAGWQLRSPLECTSVTETMPTWRDLFYQRRRWSLGAMQTIQQLGWRPETRMYFRQQAMIALGIICMGLYMSLSVIDLALQVYGFSFFWLAIGGIFAAERVATTWRDGLRSRVLAGLIWPELLYALWLQAAHVAAAWQFVTRESGSWHHTTIATA